MDTPRGVSQRPPTIPRATAVQPVLCGAGRGRRPRSAEGLTAHERADLLARGDLPRWNPGGIRDGHTADVYDGLRAWMGRDHWLSIVVPRALDAHPDVLQEASSRASVRTFETVMTVLTLYANADGRDLIVRPDTVAGLVGCKERTVQRCLAAARKLGLLVVVVPGGMLTIEQREAARARGSHQRGFSNVCALVIPDDIDPRVHTPEVVDNRRVQHVIVTPHRGNLLSAQRNVCSSLPGRLRRPVENGGATRRWQKSSEPRPRPGTATDFAYELRQHVPWLRHTAPRRMAALVRPYTQGDHPWTPAELAAAMRVVRAFPAAAHADLVLLAWYLHRINPAESPAWSRWLAAGLTTRATSGTAPQPCGHPTCDGHGWRSTYDHRGHEYLVACPECPPALRANDPWAE